MRPVLSILVLIAVAAAGTAGWFWWHDRAREAPTDLALYGNVEIRQVSLAFDGTGRIVELRAEEGDRVTAGQALGRLDTATLEIQVQQAQAEAEVQRQTLRRLRNGSRPEEIEQAEAQLASAEATAERAVLDLSRATKLKAQGSAAITQQSVDQKRADAEASRARVDELRAALHLAQLGPRAEEIAAAEAQLAASEAALALLLHRIDQAMLRAPTDAVVRSRLLEPGDMATPQSPVFALALTRPKWARVYVSEPDLGAVRPGMTAKVYIDGQPDRPIDGTVGYISSVAEFTPKSVQTEELRTSLVYEVRIVVDDAADVLRLGQPVTVHLPLGSEK